MRPFKSPPVSVLLYYARWLLLLALLVACVSISVHGGIDFVVYYQALRWLPDQFTKVYSEPAASGGRFFYGPLFLVILAPLKALDYSAAKWVWTGVEAFFFAVYWRLIYRIYPRVTDDFLAWALLFIVSINPLHTNFQSLNIQLILFCLLAAGEVFSGEDRSPAWQRSAGILVAVAAALKLYPGFALAYFLVTKSRHFRYGILIGAAFAVLAPALVFGPTMAIDLTVGFFQNLGNYSKATPIDSTSDLLCLPTLLYRMPLVHANFAYPQIVAAVGLIVGLTYFPLVFILSRRGLLRGRGGTYFWALTLALMALVNPSSLTHYYIFYIPAFCSLFEILSAEVPAPVDRNCLVAGLILAVILTSLTTKSVVGTSLNYVLEKSSAQTWGALILCVSLGWSLKYVKFRI